MALKGWFSPDKDDETNNQQQKKNDAPNIEFKPEELKADVESLKTSISGVTTQFAEFKPAMDFLAQLKADREAAIAAKRNKEANVQINSEDFLENPEGAINQKLQPIVKMQYELLAEQKKNEILNEKEYYHGDFKAKVDAMLASQPLEAKVNPTVIENCYKVVLADHTKELVEGKLKTRASLLTPSSSGTGGHSGKEGQEEGDTLSLEEKNIAGKFGMSDDEWKKAKKEMSYV